MRRTNAKSQTNVLFCKKEDYFSKEMLHKLSLDTTSWPYHIGKQNAHAFRTVEDMEAVSVT